MTPDIVLYSKTLLLYYLDCAPLASLISVGRYLDRKGDHRTEPECGYSITFSYQRQLTDGLGLKNLLLWVTTQVVRHWKQQAFTGNSVWTLKRSERSRVFCKETGSFSRHAYTPMLQLGTLDCQQIILRNSQDYTAAHQSSHASSCFFGGGAAVLFLPIPIALVPIELLAGCL